MGTQGRWATFVPASTTCELPPGLPAIQDDVFAGYDATLVERFGPSTLRYCSDMACRYAARVTPASIDPRVLHAMAQWMSMFWVLDAILDSHRDDLPPEDLHALVALLTAEDVDARLAADTARARASSRHRFPLIASMLDALPALHGKYLRLTEPYRRTQPALWRAQLGFTRGFLDKSRDRTTPDTIERYRDLRFVASGSMHVVTHLLYGRDGWAVELESGAWRRFCMVSGYVNDLASLPRDLRHGTPNLVGAIMRMTGKDVWDATREAVALAERELAALQDSGNALAIAAIEGDAVFHWTEPRFASGVAMLEALSLGDEARFHAILRDEVEFPGDPVASALRS